MLEALFAGLITGLAANAVWYWRFSKYALAAKVGDIVTFLEHYHWATIATILGFKLNAPAFLGFSLPLWLDEGIAQRHKFALGSGHFPESTLITILILAAWLLAELIPKVIWP